MRIEKIAYEQLYPTGVYANQRYRVEAEVLPTEDIEECYKHLKGIVEKTFTALNPQINWNDGEALKENFYGSGLTSGKNGSQPTIRDTVDNIIEDINSCKDEIVLQSYRIIAKKDPRIQEAFDKKLKQLMQ